MRRAATPAAAAAAVARLGHKAHPWRDLRCLLLLLLLWVLLLTRGRHDVSCCLHHEVWRKQARQLLGRRGRCGHACAGLAIFRPQYGA